MLSSKRSKVSMAPQFRPQKCAAHQIVLAVLALALFVLGYVLLFKGSSMISSTEDATLCLQPLQQLSAGQPLPMEHQRLAEAFMASACSVSSALETLAPASLASVLRTCQGHTCATLSAAGHTPTINGKLARLAATKAGFCMFVYPDLDIVSSKLADPSLRSWEQYEISQVKYALAQQLPSRLQPGSSSGGSALQRPLFVDVGANVGVFALSAAKLGARVYAFEGLADNIKMVQSSLCINPHLQQHITLFPLGLSSHNGTCWVVSDNNNVGDGMTMCGHNLSEEAQAAAQPGYTVRSRMLVRRLDDLVQEDVKVMKLDVEGHEHDVLQGATSLLSKHRVWFILAEANRDIIGMEGAYKTLALLRSLGYRVSTKGFKGPWVTDAQVEQQTVRWRDVNVFAVHEELWQ